MKAFDNIFFGVLKFGRRTGRLSKFNSANAFNFHRFSSRMLCLNANASQNAQQPAANFNAEDVIVHKIDTKRTITLNRPKSLNALNLSMIRKIYPKLKKYDENPDVDLIIIKGEGDKAFCSGGDVRAIYESRHSNPKFAADFFREEYTLNYLIGTLQVPYVAFVDGITMGGGVGLSVHGMFRVATERTVFAMPECSIGLFPDVGGTYFLPRMPANLGIFLGLTGYRLKGKELLHAGIATHYVDSNLLKDLEKQLMLMKTESLDKTSVAALLAEFQSKSKTGVELSLKPHLQAINQIFGADTVENILNNLEKDGSEWSLSMLETLQKMSPTSLKVSLKAMKNGAAMSLKQCFQTEYRIAVRCCANDDFHEGVKAALIEKNSKPKWNPSSLGLVTPQIVDRFFSKLPDEMELKIVP